MTASDLQWTPRDAREVIVRRLPRVEGKILVAPTGGNIDHMPMMAIPPGCKILIPGQPDRNVGPTERFREEEAGRLYSQKKKGQEDIWRHGSDGTRPSASQTRPSPADLAARAIAVHGDPEFIVDRLRKFLEAKYSERVAPKIVAAVPGTDGHLIIVQGTQEQVDQAEELTRQLDEHAMRLKPRSTTTSPSHPRAPAPAPDKFDIP
jgi:hypothetical protein